MGINIKKVLYIFLSALLFLFVLYFSLSYSSQEISDFISKVGIFAPLLYIIIQIVGQTFAPLSTSALFIAGFIMFGKVSIIYLIIVWLCSSVINFYIARKYGKSFLSKLIGEEWITQIEKISKKLESRNLFLLRISSFYINDFASYAFGLTDISFPRYIFFTLFSIVPWAIIMYIISKQNDTVLNTTIKLVISMIPFAILTYIFFKRKNK